jgi:hypothetical protein
MLVRGTFSCVITLSPVCTIPATSKIDPVAVWQFVKEVNNDNDNYQQKCTRLRTRPYLPQGRPHMQTRALLRSLRALILHWGASNSAPGKEFPASVNFDL